MNANESPDPLMTALGSLPAATPNAARAVRTRALCQQALARRIERRTRRQVGLPVAWVLCAVYLVDMLWTALIFYR
jgi:hypothetical protein